MKKIDFKKLEADKNTLLVSKKLGEKRKKIWQEQNKGLQINVGDCVKLSIDDVNGVEHLWFEVKEINPFIGRCDNYPVVIKKVKYNELIPFKFEDIEDHVKKSNVKINSEELSKLKAKKLFLNRIEEEKMKKMQDDCYLDFLLNPRAFNFNDNKNWEMLFTPENLVWRNKKTDKIIQPQEISITQDKLIDELSFLFTDCAFWILENYGDVPFKKVARYLHFSEKIINESISIWEKERKEVKEDVSDNSDSL